MRMMRVIRRGVPAIGLAVLAGCGGSPSKGPERPLDVEAPPPPVIDAFRRDRPVFHVLDPDSPSHYFIYHRPNGLQVLTVEPGIGLRPATPSETRFAMDRYDATHQLSAQRQIEIYTLLGQLERAARKDINADILSLMERTVQQWQEEKRTLEIKREAAQAAGLKDEATKVDPLILDLDRRILAHEIKMNLYASPEWKAARSAPREVGIPITPMEGRP
jgi:hypothetical protein